MQLNFLLRLGLAIITTINSLQQNMIQSFLPNIVPCLSYIHSLREEPSDGKVRYGT